MLDWELETELDVLLADDDVDDPLELLELSLSIMNSNLNCFHSKSSWQNCLC